jgi:glyoxylase-like metal-dependent hydrolase (beta-lactamase superfamily II)
METQMAKTISSKIYRIFAIVLLTAWAMAGGSLYAASPAWKSVDTQRYPDLYQWIDTCNVYVLKQGDSALMIDLGNGSVLDHLHEIGVNWVDWVLLAHHHREQCQGHTLLQEVTQIAASATERALFETPLAFRKLKPRLDDPFTVYGASYVRPPIQPIKLDRAFKKEDRFEWRGYSFRCLETPGHSPGSMTYFLEGDNQCLAFSGDVILDGVRYG